jgi:hypothetical protein
MEQDIHLIDGTFVPYAVVDLRPAMAEGGVTGKRRDDLLAHVLVDLGYDIDMNAFQNAPNQHTFELHGRWYFLAKVQVQTWDTV